MLELLALRHVCVSERLDRRFHDVARFHGVATRALEALETFGRVGAELGLAEG